MDSVLRAEIDKVKVRVSKIEGGVSRILELLQGQRSIN